ncbi:MAG TPA: prepilin-type N-terminal cleavage/methylation domain-containing protein, partial [Pyrinomonadaceae bacterium]|nr:prepilin-type N-terminal cleavage/methylation domain-containing protein [Pyrinomonadaceae bacterium]
MTGKSSKQQAVSSKQFALRGESSLVDGLEQKRAKLLTAHRSLLTALGFTLLELMIVISIIIILASI